MFGNFFSYLGGRAKAAAAIPTITVTPASYSTNGSDYVNCAITFNTDGSTTIYSDTGVPYTWNTIPGTVTNYSIMGTVLSGSMNIGTAATWLAFSTYRSFGSGRSAAGTTSSSVRLDIKRNSDSVIVATATVNFSATTDGPHTPPRGGGGLIT